MRSIKHMAVAAAAIAALAACDDGGVLSPDGEQNFTIRMAPESSSGSFLSSSLMAPAGASGARISMSQVESIFLPIGEVEALRSGGAQSGWVSAGSVDDVVDLLNLPEEGVTLLESSLPEGEYRALRFRLYDEPTIVLDEEVRVGRATFEAGEHPLVIPSADQAGVRLHAFFDVDSDGQTLNVLVDGSASVRRIIAAGDGNLRMAPVLRVQDRDGQDVGGTDDEDDDEDDEDDEEDEDGEDDDEDDDDDEEDGGDE